MRSVLQDLRIVLRTMRRAPYFWGGLVAMLALGTGASAAALSLATGVLLNPLPYADAGRALLLLRDEPLNSGERLIFRAKSDWLIDFRDRSRDLLEVAAMRFNPRSGTMDLLAQDRTDRLTIGYVTPGFMPLLGLTPVAGRILSEADAGDAADRIVLGEDIWERLFGRDPGVVGRTIRMATGDGGREPRDVRLMTIVGVLPRDADYPHTARPTPTRYAPDAWAVEPWSAVAGSTNRREVIVRPRGDVTPAAAQAFMDTLVPALPMTDREREQGLRLEPLPEWASAAIRPAILLIGGAAVLLVLMSAATVANGLLVRLRQTRRELAVRAALGASGGRLMRHVLVEGAVLCGLGTAAGWLTAIALLPSLRDLVPEAIPRGGGLVPDASFFVVGLGLSVVITLAATVVPTWQSRRADLLSAIRLSRVTGTGSRLISPQAMLTAVQATVAMCLLVGGGLLLASYWRVTHVDLGFEPRNLVAVEIPTPADRYPDKDAQRAFREQLLAHVRALPGVRQASLSTAVPFLTGADAQTRAYPAGCEARPVTPECAERVFAPSARGVDPEYFDMLGIRATRGRLPSEADVAEGRNVSVITEDYARLMFGDVDPVGRTYEPYMAVGQAEVVGVVPGLRHSIVERDPNPAVYVLRDRWFFDPPYMLAEVAPGAAGIEDQIRQLAHQLDAFVPITAVGRLTDLARVQLATRTFYTATTTTFGLIAVVLVAVGLSVVVGRAVVERRRELAIRQALGAGRGRSMWLVARRGLLPVATGVVAGAAAARAGAGVARLLLFAVTPDDPRAYVAAALVVVLVSAMAGLIALGPLRRLPAAALLRADEG